MPNIKSKVQFMRFSSVRARIDANLPTRKTFMKPMHGNGRRHRHCLPGSGTATPMTDEGLMRTDARSPLFPVAAILFMSAMPSRKIQNSRIFPCRHIPECTRFRSSPQTAASSSPNLPLSCMCPIFQSSGSGLGTLSRAVPACSLSHRSWSGFFPIGWSRGCVSIVLGIPGALACRGRQHGPLLRH